MRAVSFRSVRDATTGAGGRYTLEHLEPGNRIVARHTDGDPRQMEADARSVAIREGETSEVNFDEQGRIHLGGTVLRGGRPQPDNQLVFRPSPTDMRP